MALEPVWVALVDAPSLSPAQQRTVAEIVAHRGDPATAARFFARPDVTAETRALLIREAYDRQLIKAVLATPVVTTEALLIAAEKLGAETVLTEVARTRWDLQEAQLLLVKRLDHAAARRVAEAWTYFGPELRIALIDAAVRDKPQDLEHGVASDSGSKAERDAWMAQVESWHNDVWALLSAQPAESLWPELIARSPGHDSDQLIVNMILARAEELPDRTLLACLKQAFPKADPEPDPDLRGWAARLELERLADIVSRHPRALALHGPVLRPLTRSLAVAGVAEWRKKGISKWEWSTFESLAAVCTDPEVLSDAAECLATATLPSWQRDRRPDPDWGIGRSKAADALAGNPLLPSDALALIAPWLGPATAARFTQHPNEQVREAVERTVAQAVSKTEPVQRDVRPPSKEAKRPTLPSDDALAESGDPRSELASYLPLKGPAAHKRQIAQAIIESRFADADLLRELPAALVLTSASHAPGVATLLQEELGDNPQMWDTFAGKVSRMAPNATKSLTALIEEARASSTSD
jgi:hypothetical protein